jgi:hypothetical protein
MKQKLYLVTAFFWGQPFPGDGDWIRCFETREEAKEYLDRARTDAEESSEYNWAKYYFKDIDRPKDAAYIIDLKQWIEGENPVPQTLI